ncbi:MAG: peptidylprolyl isomerase [Candidatus Eisenbacteria sp.]|nr:peptidylprolyl isomerase [Candidatus Eisenbacteria bacterium]
MALTRNTDALAAGVVTLMLAAFISTVFAQDEIEPAGDGTTRQLVDGIAVVVGDEIILESEIDEEFYIYQMRTGASELPPEEMARVRSGIVREMIDETLLVAMAHRDTVQVEPGELEKEMGNRVAELVEPHGSEEALGAALAEEGLTLPELEGLYANEIERRLLAQRVVRSKVHGNIDVTWGEVESYYAEHAEEVGNIPEAFRVGGIMVIPKIKEDAKQAAIDRMTEVSERLAAGGSFEELAREYSDDASGATGGDLGTFGRGVMVPEFDDAVFAMEEGEVSGIIPTRFGFHIVEVLERSDTNMHARHILARVAPGPEDEIRARATAESLRQRVLDGEDFAELARVRSDDPATREEGGVLGWFSLENLAPSFRDVVTKLSPGEVADVTAGESGFYVLKLLEYEEARTATLDEVRENLKDYIFARKAEEAYGELIDRLSREIFVDIRTGMVAEE